MQITEKTPKKVRAHTPVAGDHSECGPDCAVTSDRCCGGHLEGVCPDCDKARGLMVNHSGGWIESLANLFLSEAESPATTELADTCAECGVVAPDHDRKCGSTSMLEVLQLAATTIEQLACQQAMPDEFYRPALTKIETTIENENSKSHAAESQPVGEQASECPGCALAHSGSRFGADKHDDQCKADQIAAAPVGEQAQPKEVWRAQYYSDELMQIVYGKDIHVAFCGRSAWGRNFCDQIVDEHKAYEANQKKIEVLTEALREIKKEAEFEADIRTSFTTWVAKRADAALATIEGDSK